MHRTRKQSDKVKGNEKFTPIDAFPLEKLPTLKNVIDRCLIKRNGKKKYKSDIHNFLEKSKILFDVFQKDKNLQSEMEKNPSYNGRS